MFGFTGFLDLFLLNFTVMVGIGVVIMPLSCEDTEDYEQNDDNQEDTIVNDLKNAIDKFSY